MENQHQDEYASTNSVEETTTIGGIPWKLIVAVAIILIPIIYVVFTQLKPSDESPSSGRVVQAEKGPAAELNNQALSAYQQEDFARCIELSQEAIGVQPNSVIAYNNMGAAYISLKEYDKAILALTRALEIDPSFQLAKNNLRWAIEAKQGTLVDSVSN